MYKYLHLQYELWYCLVSFNCNGKKTVTGLKDEITDSGTDIDSPNSWTIESRHAFGTNRHRAALRGVVGHGSAIAGSDEVSGGKSSSNNSFWHRYAAFESAGVLGEEWTERLWGTVGDLFTYDSAPQTDTTPDEEVYKSGNPEEVVLEMPHWDSCVVVNKQDMDFINGPYANIDYALTIDATQLPDGCFIVETAPNAQDLSIGSDHYTALSYAGSDVKMSTPCHLSLEGSQIDLNGNFNYNAAATNTVDFAPTPSVFQFSADDTPVASGDFSAAPLSLDQDTGLSFAFQNSGQALGDTSLVSVSSIPVADDSLSCLYNDVVPGLNQAPATDDAASVLSIAAPSDPFADQELALSAPKGPERTAEPA